MAGKGIPTYLKQRSGADGAHASHAGRVAKASLPVVFAALALFCASLFPATEAYADADLDRLHELQEQANGIRDKMDAAQSEYLAAVQMQEECDAQVASIEGEIDDNDEVLEQKREELGRLCASDYKNTKANAMYQILFDADTVSAITQALGYFASLEKDRADVIADIERLQDEHDALIEELGNKKALAVEQQASAESSKAMLDEQLEALAPELNSLQDAFTDDLAGMDEASQLKQSLDYLTDFRGITDTQVAIIRSAYSTGYAGADRCEAWAEQVYRNAGISVPMLASAWASYATYAMSDGLDDIKPGAFIYGSGTSSIYNHVGIYVGNGLVMDNEGSRSGAAVTVEEWLSWQTVTSSNNGQSGYFGWGYPPGLDFSDTNG